MTPRMAMWLRGSARPPFFGAVIVLPWKDGNLNTRLSLRVLRRKDVAVTLGSTDQATLYLHTHFEAVNNGVTDAARLNAIADEVDFRHLAPDFLIESQVGR